MNPGRTFLLLLILLVGGWHVALFGQGGASQKIRSGNRAWGDGNFQRAEGQYRDALTRDPESTPGRFNLGGALYRQERYQEAYQQYRQLFNRNADSLTMGRIAYNFGNAALQQYLRPPSGEAAARDQYLKESIEAYSKALRYNPSDANARYNLARALHYRQDPPPPQEQQQQDQHQQDEKKQEQPLPESRKKEEERKDEEKPRHEEGQISKEDAERMLNAIREKEMRTAEQINERERTRSAQPKGKDW